MRQLDWIDAFMEYTRDTTSPELFRRWGAIATIAGALERKVWVRTLKAKLYPNMYVILVAPPGVGKTEVTWRTRELWNSLEDHHIASTSVTKASLIDELSAATKRWITNDPKNPVESFNSLLLSVNELGVLIPAYENEFMNTLTDIWDCKHYSERRRTNKTHHEILAPQLNMLAGCTPSYLTGTLPEGAWDQGFLSRTILVYSGDRQITSLFGEAADHAAEQKELAESLKSIANLYGELRFTPEAATAMDNFHLTGGLPQPEHPKLFSYLTRRTVHLLKLCMVCAVSRSNELVIRIEDYERAFDFLIEVESHMPEIFKAMTQGGAGKVMEDAWYYIFTIYGKEQKPVLKHRLINFLQERVPVHAIAPTIDMMTQGRLIEKRLTEGGEAFVPRGRKANQ